MKNATGFHTQAVHAFGPHPFLRGPGLGCKVDLVSDAPSVVDHWVAGLSTDCTLTLEPSFAQAGLPLSSFAFEIHLFRSLG